MLAVLQATNAIPTPPPGTCVSVVLLTSAAAAAKYDGKKGVVVAPAEGQPALKAGRAAVLLEGEANPISFKLMNLRIDGGNTVVPGAGDVSYGAGGGGGGGGGGLSQQHVFVRVSPNQRW